MLTSCPCNGEGAGAQCSQERAPLGVHPASEHQSAGGAHVAAKAHMLGRPRHLLADPVPVARFFSRSHSVSASWCAPPLAPLGGQDTWGRWHDLCGGGKSGRWVPACPFCPCGAAPVCAACVCARQQHAERSTAASETWRDGVFLNADGVFER